MPPKRKSEEVKPEPKSQKTVEKIGHKYLDLFRDAQKDVKKEKQLLEKVIEEENWYRELFARERDSKELQDPHLMLVPVLDNEASFRYQPLEEDVPQVFPVDEALRKKAGDPIIVDRKEFERNFKIFTERQLEELNWNNVFIAGGSVLACLQRLPEAFAQSNRTRRNYFHNIAYLSSDVDIFVYGLDDQEAANRKIEEIYTAIVESITSPAICFRSKHAVSIVSQYPYRHIQIILRMYASPAEVLMGFDVDCCSLGYDGKQVWMTPRAHRALCYQANTIDMSRRSPTYEQRLAKYAERGFAVNVPSLDRSRLDPQLFERRFDQLQGLAKLLLLERISTPEARTAYKEKQRLLQLRPESKARVSILGQLASEYDDEYNRQRAHEVGGAGNDVSDYSTVFLPWGPKWTAEKVRKLMYTKDMILNSEWYDPNKQYHTHPCFFGTASQIVKDCCGTCPPVPPEKVDPDTPYVSGTLTWVTVNPGAQGKIGSFHPITEGDWTEGAYLSPKSAELFKVINDDDHKALEKQIKSGESVDSRDLVGRTALQFAALVNAVKCAEVLLKHDCNINLRMIDGRTALHLAAAYGHVEIVKMIVQKGKELKEKPADDKKGKKGKKEKKSAKPKKKKGSDDEDEDEEMEDADEEGEEDEDEDGGDGEEGDEGEGEDEEDEDAFSSLKKILEHKKKEEKKKLEELDPSLDANANVFEIDAVDWDLKMSALHYAAFFGFSEVAKVLVKAGADVHNPLKYPQTQYPVLHLTLINKHADTLTCLLNLGAKIDQLDSEQKTIYFRACEIQDTEFITLLLNYESKDEQKRCDVNVVVGNRTPMNEYLAGLGPIVNNYHGHHHYRKRSKNAKKAAAARGKDEMDTEDEDEKYKDVFTEEARDILKLMIKRGAKVHFTEDDVDESKDDDHLQVGGKKYARGNTKKKESATNLRQKLRQSREQPIFQAASLMSPKLLAFLIDNGADINFINSSNTTVFDSAKRNYKDCIRNLKNWEKQNDREEYRKKKSLRKKGKADADDFNSDEESSDDEDPNNNNQEDNRQFFIEQWLKKCKDKSTFLYEEVKFEEGWSNRSSYGRHHRHFGYNYNYHQRAYKSISVLSEEEEEKQKQKARRDLEKQVERARDMCKAIKKAKGVSFWDLKLTKEDEDLKQYQKDHRPRKHPRVKQIKPSRVKPDHQIKIVFNSIEESVGSMSISSATYADEQQDDYLKLYEAVVKGDVKTIEKLSIKKKVGEQVHVASYCTVSGRTPLHVAVLHKQDKVLKTLLDIALQQYTPIVVPERKQKESKAPTQLINNYELAMLMKKVKPGQYINANREIVDADDMEEEEKTDPDAPVIQLNCSTSLTSLLSHKESGDSRNIIHYAMANLEPKEYLPLVEIIFKFIKDNKIEVPEEVKAPIDPDARPVRREKEAPKLPFKIVLGREVNEEGYTPLDVCIIKGDVEGATFFLQQSGVAPKEKTDTEGYTGLDVDGQKMEWAHEYSGARKGDDTDDRRVGIHLAAYFDQVESVKFLLSDTPKKILKDDWEAAARYFDHTAVTADLNNAIHYAVAGNSIHVVEVLVKATDDKMDNKGRLIDAKNREGFSPLLLAINLHDMDHRDEKNKLKPLDYRTMIDVLLKNKANTSIVDSRSWGPLHHAVDGGHLDLVQKLVQDYKLDRKFFNLNFSTRHFQLENVEQSTLPQRNPE
eukprot:TRINITY_DN516_c0_g1_i3.p1 TRINITY_DN516_c0_g1~~TRINITY_DN516_c0_g1_i3.p1  ORF type:complete len:1681 (+),score=670.06 TRINITY_DN516_c0_g1_i3:13-5055(+)